MPTEKAHGLQIMKTCEALARQGIEVQLIIPRRLNNLKDDIFNFYNAEKNFIITKVWCLDLISLNIFGRLGYWIESWTFYNAALKILKENAVSIYYTRDLPIAFWLSKKNSKVYYEIHSLPDNPTIFHRQSWYRCWGLVVISNGIKKYLESYGVAPEKILIARDAVDVEQSMNFSDENSRRQARELLQLPINQKIVVYTGHLYKWKGAEILAEAAGKLSNDINDIHVYLVGGTKKDIAIFRKKYHLLNLHIVGWTPHRLIVVWHQSSDLLVIPTSGEEKIGRIYTSPLKLFEYMIAKRPIVASDIPALREILDETMATFFAPDNPNSLVEQIQLILSSPKKAEKKVVHAYEEVKRKYSWGERAKLINDFIFAKHE